MGNGAATAATHTLLHEECLAEDEEPGERDIQGQQFECVLETGMGFSRFPTERSARNEVAGTVEYGEIVKPVAKKDNWLKIGHEMWLPVTMFWAPTDNRGNHLQLLRRVDDVPAKARPRVGRRAQSDPGPSGRPEPQGTSLKRSASGNHLHPVVAGWGVIGNVVSTVKITDYVECFIKKIDDAKLRTLQAAVRKRQNRKQRKQKHRDSRVNKVLVRHASLHKQRSDPFYKQSQALDLLVTGRGLDKVMG